MSKEMMTKWECPNCHFTHEIEAYELATIGTPWCPNDACEEVEMEPFELKTIKIVCGHCGSDDVRRDAWAEWDVRTQAWVLGQVFDAGHCEKCGGEALKDVEIPNLFMRVEYDKKFCGGEYSGTGEFALIPVGLVDEYGGMDLAFEAQTGLNPVHIIHYSEDELFDAAGEHVEV